MARRHVDDDRPGLRHAVVQQHHRVDSDLGHGKQLQHVLGQQPAAPLMEHIGPILDRVLRQIDGLERELYQELGKMPENPDIENRFTYHKPRDGQEEHFHNLRASAKATAQLIDAYVPEGREKSLALTKLEEAVFWANAGIARHG